MRIELSDLRSKPAATEPLPSFEEEFFSFPKRGRQFGEGIEVEMRSTKV